MGIIYKMGSCFYVYLVGFRSELKSNVKNTPTLSFFGFDLVDKIAEPVCPKGQ